MLTEDDKDIIGLAVANIVADVLESHLKTVHGMNDSEVENILKLSIIDITISLKKKILKEGGYNGGDNG